MAYDTNTTRRDANLRSETPVSTGLPFWDMMLQMQRASTQALSSFVPLARFGAQESSGRFDTPSSGHSAQRTSNSVEVIPVGEETFHVGTHTVQGETTRLRRIVVETPVEQQVSLRTETVVVERRKPVNAVPNGDILTEKSVEMTDSFQVADTWKSVHLREEVVLRTEVTEQVETVRDTIRRGEVVVEQAKRPLPAFPQANKSQPAQLVANLETAAERFETNAGQQEKALATLHKTLDAEAAATKAEHKPAASQPQVQSLKATAQHSDKGSNSHKS